MKKKYGLEAIIGKKSKLRFPRVIPRNESLTFLLPANSAIAEPPLNTSITMKKADPYEFCDQFNEESYEYEEGFPLNVIMHITGSEFLFEIKSPTVFTLFSIIFDLEDIETERFRAPKGEVFLSIFNFALIKLNPDEDFFMSDLISTARSIYGNLVSYNCRRKKKRRAKALIPTVRTRRYYINKDVIPYNYKRYLSRIKHFFVRNSKKGRMKHYKYLLEHIDDFYDMYEDWDEAYDFYWDDHYTDIFNDLHEYILLSLYFETLQANHTNHIGLPNVFRCRLQALVVILRGFYSDSYPEADLSIPLIANINQILEELWLIEEYLDKIL